MKITPSTFASIVQMDPINKKAEEIRRCPDDFIEWSFIDGNRTELNERIDAEKRSDSPCVVLILESPHVDEFPEDGGRIGPALGKTGSLIGRYLGEILLATHLRDHAMECKGILLVNAVQYQCSLGESRKQGGGKTRDRVFSETWAHGGRDDFSARLKSILHEGDLVINSCTTGNLRTPLWISVEEVVREVRNGRPSDLRLYHPSTWDWGREPQPL